MDVHQFINDVSPDQGGPAYSVTSLCYNLTYAGVICRLISSHDGSLKDDHVLKLWSRKGCFSWVNGVVLVTQFSLTRNAPILHSHNLWTYTNLIPSIAAKLCDAKHVLSPRGSLTAYSMSVGSRFKPMYWRFFERHVLKSCAAFHATSEQEFADIRRLGFDQPVAIVPNGIDLPKILPSNKKRQVLFFVIGVTSLE